MPRIARLPDATPGQMTLQAKPAAWAEAVALITDPRAQVALADALAKADQTQPAIRLTFPTERAIAILRACGMAV